MKKKLTANLGLKILAVLFSIVIWFIVVNINDPVDKTVFRNVQVEILNPEAITSEGKVYEILDETDVVDVTIWAKRSILDTLGRENVIATADMQEMNFKDTMVRIKFATNKYNDKLESIKSSTENLLVNVEDMKQRQFVIETATAGEPAESCMLGTVSADQNLVRLSGPESSIEKVARVAAVVDVSGLAQDVRTDSTLRLYDAEDNLVEDKNIKKSIEQVKINVEILQTKRVPLSFKTSGTPAEGYAVTGVIESDPSSVLIAGKGSLIKNISQIEIPDTALNITGQNTDVEIILELKKYLPENIILAESGYNGRLRVIVFIAREESLEVAVDENDITVTGIPEGLKGEIQGLSEETLVQVRGLPENMEGLEEVRITGTIDMAAYMKENGLEELTPGSYEAEIILNLPDGIKTRNPLKARVVISLTEDAVPAEENNEE